MKVKIFTILSIIVGTALANNCPENSDKVVACYYSSWSIYREGFGHFNTTHINSTLCTHLIYTFAGLDIYSKITPIDHYNDIQRGAYKAFTKLKESNPCVKTLLAIGGWNEGSIKYSVMSYTKESREAFADSVLRFLVAYEFDGLDIDWEYPTQRGGLAADRENFVELIKVLHEKLKIWKLILTIAVPVSREITEKAYDIPRLLPYVEYIFLMAYDYTSSNSKITGLSSPLNPIKETVEWWLKSAPPNKLVMGIATYGRSFTLENSTDHGIGAKTLGPGEPGKYTREAGFLSYYEIEGKLATNRYSQVLSSEDTYYAYSNQEWLTFDLPYTYDKKVEYALEKNLGGIMVWTIDTDDFAGIYSKSAYPILKNINRILNRI